MSGRLAFQTQLASIMEVLANAAVAEICKLVDDDYALVSLQMSQCQRENKALKRKLHLLELKVARGAAERRLRDSAMNSSRPRVQLSAGDRVRDATPATGGVFERQVEASLWAGGAAGGAPGEPMSQSPDVELVEPEALLVKEEKVEANMSPVEEAEEDVRLIGDDGVLECAPRGAAAQRLSFQPQDSHNQSMKRRSDGGGGGRGVEKCGDPDVVLVKVEEGEGGEPAVAGAPSRTGLSIQEGLVESSTDNYQGVLPFHDEASPSRLSDLQECGRGFSELTQEGSKDSSSIVSVQLRVADTNTPPNPTSQQQRSSASNPLGSDYSLFELETFFTRWAPDGDSTAPPRGPSCSFSTDESTDCDQDGVIVVEAEPRADPAARLGGGQSFSASQGAPEGSSVSTAPRPPWTRTLAGSSPAAQRLPQHQASPGGTSSSAGTPQDAAPPRGSAAAPLNGVEAALAAQYRADLLARHAKSQAAAAVAAAGERRLKRYVCRTCGKAFSGLSNLEAHERVHTGEKPFRCDTCGKRFSEAGNLKKHQRVHTGEKPFSCHQCGKRFAWICNLRTHQQSATGCAAAATATAARPGTHC